MLSVNVCKYVFGFSSSLSELTHASLMILLSSTILLFALLFGIFPGLKSDSTEGLKILLLIILLNVILFNVQTLIYD